MTKIFHSSTKSSKNLKVIRRKLNKTWNKRRREKLPLCKLEMFRLNLSWKQAREEAIRQELIRIRAWDGNENGNAGQGLVWNTGYNFWRKSLLVGLMIGLKNWLMIKLSRLMMEVLIWMSFEVLGDSSVSIQKGKKIVAYCHEF